jgi:hypothetical protein
MLVVPNNKTAKEAPKVEGMMVYRKDNNKIYVQGDRKLNALAEEKKVCHYIQKKDYMVGVHLILCRKRRS